MSRRKKHKRSGKRLIYGSIAVAFILICVIAYSYLNPSNRNPSNPPPSPSDEMPIKAAIVDHLSFKEETKNETFKEMVTTFLDTCGFDVTYYSGEEVVVDFYRDLPTHGYSLIILRVHSAIIGESDSLGLFTSELYSQDKAETVYYSDIVFEGEYQHDSLVKAYFSGESTCYFGIGPKFIEKRMNGRFEDTVIIMMGCDGLKYNKTAEAFIKKGAKVCVGWNGLVSTLHTDHATTRLLKHLIQKNTIKIALEKTMSEVGPEKMYIEDQGYESVLRYYPETTGTAAFNLPLTSFGYACTN